MVIDSYIFEFINSFAGKWQFLDLLGIFFAKGYIKSLIDYDPEKTAFPSGHASFYFALSTIIYGYNKKAGILFFIGSFLIVLARVFVGLHWPSDILAGAILGIIMGIILNKLFKKILLKKHLDQ